MIHVKKESTLLKKIRTAAYKSFSYLENNNDSRFELNGEALFLKNYFLQLKGRAFVFDVGANEGKYSAIVSTLAEKHQLDLSLHVFEPVETSFRKLEENFNGAGNIKLNNFGVSDSDSVAEIFYDKQGSTLASLYQRDLSDVQIHLDKKEQISLRRLDGYITSNHIPFIDLLKIDVEGHELAAFKGLGNFLDPGFTKAIQFEYGASYIDSRTFLKDIYQLLTSKNYRICKITRTGIEERKYHVRMENFAYANYLALAK